jgi:deoxyribonucleoside regulator
MKRDLYAREEIQLMVQVARMYYENQLNQEEIARRLNLTRQKVSRLLIAARSQGIIKTVINDPYPGDPYLGEELKSRFKLRSVVLAMAEGLEGNQLRTGIGLAASEYLRKTIQKDQKIGIGWGRTLFETIVMLRESDQRKVNVIPLIGGIGDLSPFFQVNELARRLANAFDGTYRQFYAPAFVEDSITLEKLLKTQEILQAVELWSHLDVAIVGIGHVGFQHISSMFFADHISPRRLAQLEAKGAVGDICARFLDINGNQILPGMEVIGINLTQLKAIPEVIAIAGGIEKVRAVLGALRGGYITTLVTDASTARAIMRESEERR